MPFTSPETTSRPEAAISFFARRGGSMAFFFTLTLTLYSCWLLERFLRML